MATLTRPSLAPQGGAAQPGLLARAVRGPLADTWWVRPALIGVVALAAVLYLWDLTISGYANAYYAAAAEAASQSWSAWFFGSLDAGNFITVDKPPLNTMVLGLSVRLLGLSPTAILLPQALMGVATVLALFAAVRRSFGAVAGLIAALVMALTPVAVLIFRFDNPDALLTLLLVLSAWAFVRGLSDGRRRWLVVSALLVGLAFDTKFLQAWLVLPAFAITYLMAAPGRVAHRLGALALSLVIVLLASGWWVVVVDLIPAGQRPFIGGSTDGTALQLLLGYDGIGRIVGGAAGGLVGPGGDGGFGGPSGLLRMLDIDFGGQISWLLPLAFLALVSGLAIHWRARRTDAARAGYLLWGLWLVVHALVFSFMTGIIHPYYAVAMAPAMAALIGGGVVDLGGLARRSPIWAVVLAAGLAVSTGWALLLLGRSPAFWPGLGIAAVALAVSAGLLVLVGSLRSSDRLVGGAVALGLAAVLAGPTAYAGATVQTAYDSGDPKAGPAVASDRGAFGSFGGNRPGVGAFQYADRDQALIDYLVAHMGSATWLVATSGSGSAAGIQLATGEPVMAMGGFTGSDPTPTLAELEGYVASGKLRYLLVGDGGGPGAGFGRRSEITDWAIAHGSVVDYGGAGTGLLYDLSGGLSSGG